MSGIPVAAPALSLHAAIALASSRKSAEVPSMANEEVHAANVPLTESSGVIFESHGLTTTFRQATPPSALMVLPQAVTASIAPWKSPGASGDPVSAMTKTVISVGVTPTSVACSGSLPHFAAAACAVDSVVAGVEAAGGVAVVCADVAAVVAAADALVAVPLLSSPLRPQAAAVAISTSAAAQAEARRLVTLFIPVSP